MAIVLNVSGGRDNNDWRSLFATLDALHKEHGITTIRHGACKRRINGEWVLTGTDKWAEQWALQNEVPYEGFPAQWEKVGHKGAGRLRNNLMARLGADYWVLAEGGPGTAHATSAAIACGIECIPVIPLGAHASV